MTSDTVCDTFAFCQDFKTLLTNLIAMHIFLSPASPSTDKNVELGPGGGIIYVDLRKLNNLKKDSDFVMNTV